MVKNAVKAASQIKKGAGVTKAKVRTKVHFYKPKTLTLARKPKYQKKAVPSIPKLDKYRVIKYPLTTEVITYYLFPFLILTVFVSERNEKDRG